MDQPDMPDWDFQKEFQATDLATRNILAQLCAGMRRAGAPPDLLFRVEIVLAELLNNITEHAYCAQPGGKISLHLWLRRGHVHARISDFGAPMRNERAPDGVLPPTNVEREALPEGGFGWHLIRTQSDSLQYQRIGAENRTMLAFHPRSVSA